MLIKKCYIAISFACVVKIWIHDTFSKRSQIKTKYAGDILRYGSVLKVIDNIFFFVFCFCFLLFVVCFFFGFFLFFFFGGACCCLFYILVVYYKKKMVGLYGCLRESYSVPIAIVSIYRES